MARRRPVAALLSILAMALYLAPCAGAMTPSTSILPGLCITLLIFRIVLCAFVIIDSLKRKDAWAMWVLLVLMFGMLAVLVYAFTRGTPEGPRPPPSPGPPRGARYPSYEPVYPAPEGAYVPLPEGLCPSCNARIRRGIDLCPRCGERRR